MRHSQDRLRIGFVTLVGLLGVLMVNSASAMGAVSASIGANGVGTPTQTRWYALCSTDLPVNEAITDANIMVKEGGTWREYNGTVQGGVTYPDSTVTFTPGYVFGTNYGYNVQALDLHHHHDPGNGTYPYEVKVRTYYSQNGTPQGFVDSNVVSSTGCTDF